LENFEVPPALPALVMADANNM